MWDAELLEERIELIVAHLVELFARERFDLRAEKLTDDLLHRFDLIAACLDDRLGLEQVGDQRGDQTRPIDQRDLALVGRGLRGVHEHDDQRHDDRDHRGDDEPPR